MAFWQILHSNKVSNERRNMYKTFDFAQNPLFVYCDFDDIKFFLPDIFKHSAALHSAALLLQKFV